MAVRIASGQRGPSSSSMISISNHQDDVCCRGCSALAIFPARLHRKSAIDTQSRKHKQFFHYFCDHAIVPIYIYNIITIKINAIQSISWRTGSAGPSTTHFPPLAEDFGQGDGDDTGDRTLQAAEDNIYIGESARRYYVSMSPTHTFFESNPARSYEYTGHRELDRRRAGL